MFGKLLPVLPIKIEEDNSDLSPQHKLLIEQQYFSLTQIDRANEQLDTKALQLLQISGLILALVGALEMPSFIIGDPTLLAMIGIAIGFLSFLGMIALLMLTVTPATSYVPGTQDWDKIYDKYITVELVDSYDKILMDCLHAFDKLSILNQHKANNLRWAVGLFLFQVVGLLILAMTA